MLNVFKALEVIGQNRADHDLYKFTSGANSIIAESKQTQFSSVRDIAMGWEIALHMRPKPNPLRRDTLRSLFAALAIKYVEGGDAEDLDEAMSVAAEASEPQLTESTSQVRLDIYWISLSPSI